MRINNLGLIEEDREMYWTLNHDANMRPTKPA